MKKVIWIVSIAVGGFGLQSCSTPPAGILTTTVEQGAVSGVKLDSSDVVSFKGIPFAAPPVGDLRWKEPQPPASWEGTKVCDAYGPSPMQPKPVPFMVYTSEFLIPEEPISEDCLYLNIWTAAQSKDEKRPVLVWIYGGGFSSGGSACPIYDGEVMAKKGVIFVSINYRVGVFGFLSHPELTAESPHKASGNYGLMDQIAALQWVKKNIAAFGGDPNNVTIDGQSAGSMSVNALVASPVAKGLFHKAIAESGSLVVPGAFSNSDLAQAEAMGVSIATSLGADNLAALRSLPADSVLKKARGQFRPIADGYVLPQSMPEIFAQRLQADVPLITGWNADEAFVPGFKSKEDYIKEAKEKYGKEADTFLSFFPASTDEEAKESQVAISRNTIFAISDYKWASIQSKGQHPAFVYYFKRRPPATGDFVQYKAFHTAEVPYALGTLQYVNRPWEDVDHQLSSMMSSYWVNFAKTGDPNGEGLPRWPAFDENTNQAMIIDAHPAAGEIPGIGGIDFMYNWNTREH